MSIERSDQHWTNDCRRSPQHRFRGTGGHSPSRTAAALVSLLALGCGDDASDSQKDNLEASDGSTPAYIVGSTLNGPEGWNAYVAVLPELAEEEVDYDAALEVTGRADVWVRDGKVFIAQAESPVVTRYAVTDDLELVQEAEPVSFAATGLASAQFWNALWLTPEKAYMSNLSALEYIVWNPSTMEIVGSTPQPEISELEGYVVRAASANRGSIQREGKIYHSYYWTDENYEKYAPESRIAVYDIETDELLSVIEAPCPGLEIATQDEDDNLYFSSWTGLPGLSLVLGEPTSCSVKIPAGSDEVDASWTVSWPDVTDGRHAAALRYQGDGYGLVSVFHDERLEYDSMSDPFELIGTENWQTWRFDFSTQTAELFDAIDSNSGAIYVERIDDLAYALVPTTDYKSSIIYEVDGASARPLFETRGWSTRLFKLR